MLINYYNISCIMLICVSEEAVHIMFVLVGVSSPSQSGHRDQTLTLRLGRKCLYLLSHIASPLQKVFLSQITLHPQKLMSIVFVTFS